MNFLTRYSLSQINRRDVGQTLISDQAKALDALITDQGLTPAVAYNSISAIKT
jgi:hypothetical protein